MGGSSKLDKLKAMQKEGKKGIVVDKTFGLKNKNKSKKVQQFCKQVQETQNKNKGIDAESKKKKKMSKLALTQRLFRTFPNFKLRRRRLHETAPPRWRLHDHMRVDAPRECTEAVSRRCPCHTGPRDVRAAPVPGPGHGARP